ncbi:MAG TPA: hypothetical protein VLZ84_04810 [Asticcacaulis sp.]|nr:hypothetical protein [Asticcacaulis sp.]
MSHLQRKLETTEPLLPAPASQVKAASNVTLVTPAAEMQAVQSPALSLRAGLEESLETSWNAGLDADTVSIQKLPFGLTLIGMSVICAGFWYTLATLVF